MADKTITRQVSIFINDREVVNSLGGINREIGKVTGQLKQLEKGQEGYNEKVKQYKTTLAELKARQADFKDELYNTHGALGKLSQTLGPVGKGMLAAFSVQSVIQGVTDGIRNAWNMVVEFNQKQADLAAIMGKSRTAIRNLTADAIKFGATTSYSATEVSELQTELARLGKTEGEIRGMTKAVLESATALETGLGAAAELVGGQLNSYNESAQQSQRFSDIMANSVNISATSFESLSTALPKVSAVAYQSDVSFEKLNATLGVLADQNVAAETAGTGFRNILLESAKVGKPYQELLDQIKNSTNQTRTATELFGKENATVAVILANSTDKIEANTKALENSAGSAEKLAREKLNSIKGATSEFSSAWEGFILNLEKGDGPLSRVITQTIKFGTAVLGLLTPTRQLSDEIRDEQVELNTLVSRITSTNISNDERKRLMIQLKEEYPGFIENIDIESASNEELKKQLVKVNEEYRQRILLQKQVERRDEAKKELDKFAGDYSEKVIELAEKLQQTAAESDITFTVDYGNVQKSAEQLKKTLEDAGKLGFWDEFEINRQLRILNSYDKIVRGATKSYGNQEDVLKKVQQSLGIKTEAEKESAALIAEQADQMKALRIEAEKLGMVNADTASDAEVKKWVAAYNARKKYSELSAEEQREAERKQKEAERVAKAAREAFEKGEKEIDALIAKTRQEREAANLTGLQREIKNIENKYATEIEKFKEHTKRLAELEVLRDQEIADAKAAKAKEYGLQIDEINAQLERDRELLRFDQEAAAATTEEDKQRILLEKAQFLAEWELDHEMEKELAKVEEVENAEALKQAIRDRYAQKGLENAFKFAEASKAIMTDEKKWSEKTEKEKFEFIKSNLNNISDAFNKGSNAWKAIKVAETTITTYQAAMDAYQGMIEVIPGPVGIALGAAAAAATTMRGIKQIQEIQNTKIQKAPKFFRGGHTGSDAIAYDEFGKITGYVHDDEYVIPKVMKQNPRYANVIGWLEGERLKLNGHYTGGYTSNPTPAPVYTDNATSTAPESRIEALLSAVLNRLENPVSPILQVGYRDVEELETMRSEITQSNQNGTINP